MILFENQLSEKIARWNEFLPTLFYPFIAIAIHILWMLSIMSQPHQYIRQNGIQGVNFSPSSEDDIDYLITERSMKSTHTNHLMEYLI